MIRAGHYTKRPALVIEAETQPAQIAFHGITGGKENLYPMFGLTLYQPDRLHPVRSWKFMHECGVAPPAFEWGRAGLGGSGKGERGGLNIGV